MGCRFLPVHAFVHALNYCGEELSRLTRDVGGYGTKDWVKWRKGQLIKMTDRLFQELDIKKA